MIFLHDFIYFRMCIYFQRIISSVRRKFTHIGDFLLFLLLIFPDVCNPENNQEGNCNAYRKYQSRYCKIVSIHESCKSALFRYIWTAFFIVFITLFLTHFENLNTAKHITNFVFMLLKKRTSIPFFGKKMHSTGIEPALTASEAIVLSIRLRVHAKNKLLQNYYNAFEFYHIQICL